MNPKLLYTKSIHNELCAHITTTSATSFTNLFYDLWHNPRIEGGFRLSDSGYKLLLRLGKKGTEVPLEVSGFSARIMLDLERKCPCPYYLGKPAKLFLYDDREVVVYTLAGSLQQYLQISSRTPDDSTV